MLVIQLLVLLDLHLYSLQLHLQVVVEVDPIQEILEVPVVLEEVEKELYLLFPDNLGIIHQLLHPKEILEEMVLILHMERAVEAEQVALGAILQVLMVELEVLEFQFLYLDRLLHILLEEVGDMVVLVQIHRDQMVQIQLEMADLVEVFHQ